jgi:hypothetical protein
MMAGPTLSGRRDHISNAKATMAETRQTRKLLAITDLNAWIDAGST